jgi:tRNA(Ile)-lysidine synthase
MLPTHRSNGVHILRPLLGFRKADLAATCRAAGQAWVEDPSNTNRKSARVRLRQARALLAEEGLDDDRLLATVGHMQRARQAIRHGVAALLENACPWDSWGCAHLALAAFLKAPAEIALRALAHVLKAASGAAYGPRFENLERLFMAMTRGPWRDATLHGCVVARDGTGVVIFREAAAVAGEAPLRPAMLWDGRFQLQAPFADTAGMIVTRVGAAAWRAMAETMTPPDIQPHVRAALPMIADAHGIVAIPNAGFIRADMEQRLKSPILSVFAPRAWDDLDRTDMWPK